MTGRRGRAQIVAGASVVVLAALLPAGVAQAQPTGSTTAGSSGNPNATCDPFIKFGSEQFNHATQIDNRYLPMVPGTRLTYRGEVTGAGPHEVVFTVTGAGPHEVVFTVTDMTKVIDGVQSRVIYD